MIQLHVSVLLHLPHLADGGSRLPLSQSDVPREDLMALSDVIQYWAVLLGTVFTLDHLIYLLETYE